jgi:hypothetical protein
MQGLFKIKCVLIFMNLNQTKQGLRQDSEAATNSRSLKARSVHELYLKRICISCQHITQFVAKFPTKPLTMSLFQCLTQLYTTSQTATPTKSHLDPTSRPF